MGITIKELLDLAEPEALRRCSTAWDCQRLARDGASSVYWEELARDYERQLSAIVAAKVRMKYAEENIKAEL